MPAQPLNLKERAVLLALLAEARPLTNAELRESAGITLDGASRLKLNELKLVSSSKEGRAFVHEITDDGAAWCADELTAERPERSGAGGGALYAVLAGLQRYLQRTGQLLSDLFQPAEPVDDLETRVRTAYGVLSSKSGSSWVGLAALRAELTDVDRADLDAVLQQLSRQPGVHVQAEANQQALTGEDHEAAVRFGGSSRHLLKIDNP
ncbi:hypothetical protein [Kribbella sp. CA-293567]|uniref:hypothetical protein n=1 Tax=Kribbella sp. CA-293567 TaxID=3002436 RepID=UPI0022DE19C0|nr:hypothetical protein [Kribbella sp. CA-293567]WBQ05341.1 hypothetical protein OX958_00745 [Kribbella sp. CA-293567]